MSSKTIDKNIREIENIEIEEPLKLKDAIVPFSNFGSSIHYIYYGHERIPFQKRHPIYQIIFREEFCDALKSFINSQKNI